MLSKTKMTVFLAVALLAFESFGFGFLLDAAKLAIGVSVMAVQNIRNCGRTPSANPTFHVRLDGELFSPRNAA